MRTQEPMLACLRRAPPGPRVCLLRAARPRQNTRRMGSLASWNAFLLIVLAVRNHLKTRSSWATEHKLWTDADRSNDWMALL